MSKAKDIQEMLNTDPLVVAEKITGKSYKDDEKTVSLGFMLHLHHNKQKDKMLTEAGDSTLLNKLDSYLNIVTDLGFELALEIPFKGTGYSASEEVDEKLFFMVHKTKGMLLRFDTFNTDGVNSSTVYYNWRPIVEREFLPPGILSSGGWESESDPNWRRNPKYNQKGSPDDKYWRGDHDAREALRHKISQLDEYGKFLNPWPKDDERFLWLLHYMDSKVLGYDYKAICKERINMLPTWAREIIRR